MMISNQINGYILYQAQRCGIFYRQIKFTEKGFYDDVNTRGFRGTNLLP